MVHLTYHPPSLPKGVGLPVPHITYHTPHTPHFRKELLDQKFHTTHLMKELAAIAIHHHHASLHEAVVLPGPPSHHLSEPGCVYTSATYEDPFEVIEAHAEGFACRHAEPPFEKSLSLPASTRLHPLLASSASLPFEHVDMRWIVGA